jgi:ABC-type branched-subunit amino acid transport system ATPase component
MNAAETGQTVRHGAGARDTKSGAGEQALLEVRNLHKHFGGVKVVNDCSFAIRAGTVTGLVGPNGAGKSTMFNLVTGVLKPDSGRIVFDGDAVQGRSPERVVRHGIGRTFQTPRLFFELTAWENLMVAGRDQPGEHFLANLVRHRVVRQAERALSDKAHDVLAFLRLDRLANEMAGSLSGGQRKLLSLGRVLMMEPRMILLDEPAAGVNETLAQELFDHIQVLNRQGITFLVIEHNMSLIMRLSDELVVMHNGRTLAQGLPADIQRNQDVLDAYLGGHV